LLVFASSVSLAEGVNDTFLPSEVLPYATNVQSYTTLSNEDLAIRAAQMRYEALTPSQRAMNYQWLSEHSDSEKTVHGERAITKLIERHLKSYIDEKAGGIWLKEKLMPDPSGNGFIKSVDYDVKLRSDQLVIGITYDF